MRVGGVQSFISQLLTLNSQLSVLLSLLRIKNLALVEYLEWELTSGFTAITGETGAGKTLLVDALELLCGGRADPAMVRDGAAEARVEGRFEHGDDEVVVARVVPREGRSRGWSLLSLPRVSPTPG